MRVILAPMEGVADVAMRELLTSTGGYDMCITEFIRVVNTLLPEKVFYRDCPELLTDSKTTSGTPVRVQLLGQDANWMAENAYRATELGSFGLDLNFGCPSKNVNGSLGGAAMLKHPESIYQVVKSVRDAVPKQHVVSAKIRLGWENKEDCFDIVQAVVEGGADELTVHARTKMDGYKAPAHWQYIAQIKQRFDIPLIANGEIWGLDDRIKCQQISQVEDVMIGRGALNIPNLAQVVKGTQAPMPWQEVLLLIQRFLTNELAGRKASYFPARIKQWLRYLKVHYPEAEELFRQVRPHMVGQPIVEVVEKELKEGVQNPKV